MDLMVIKAIGKTIEKIKLTDKVFKLQFEIPSQIDFQPGQFMSIEVAPSIRRSYSISNHQLQTNILETLVDITPGGPGSQFFMKLAVGDPVSMLVPLGVFVYVPAERPVHFYSTGTGLAPLISMIQHALENESSQRKIELFQGFRFEEDLFYMAELNELADRFANFKYTFFVSQPQSKLEIATPGYINQFINSGELNTDIDAYICGATKVIEATRDLLALSGVDKQNIHYEKYY